MSRLLKNSDQYRDPLIAKNKFSSNDDYNIGNSRALSDGDEFGKGETTTIGSATDIRKRQELSAKNIYSKNSPYDIESA